MRPEFCFDGIESSFIIIKYRENSIKVKKKKGLAEKIKKKLSLQEGLLISNTVYHPMDSDISSATGKC
jgi:hypothetical protein